VQICRARVSGEPVLEDTEDLMEATRAALSPLIGHDLMAMRRHRGDQAAFAPHALSIARLLADMLRGAQEEGVSLADAVDAIDNERAAFSLLMDLDAQAEDGMAATAVGAARQVVAMTTATRFSPPPMTARCPEQAWCVATCWSTTARNWTSASPALVSTWRAWRAS
jgi:hypothetical protein